MGVWTRGVVADRELADKKLDLKMPIIYRELGPGLSLVGSFPYLFSSHGSFNWLGLGTTDMMRFRRLITLRTANKVWEVGSIDRGVFS
jgi:hypothetical protein